jgi:putative phage-type endonuclease
MLTQEQKEIRKSGIGGSDASKIAGHNKYNNAVDVYLVKTGQKEEKDFSDFYDLRSDPRHWGNVLEPVVAQQYEYFEGEKVIVEPQLLRHPKYTWMIANIDRRIEGKNAVLECKTCHEYKYKEWGEEGSDNIPDEYLFQCMHYAIVCDVDYVDIAVLIGGNKFKTYRYVRDKETEELLIEIEHNFWHNNVLKRIPPDPKTYEEACKLWRKPKEATKTLPSELLDHWNSYNFTNNKIKELEEQLDFDKARLCGYMEESSTLLSPLGAVIATWKEQIMERLDTKRLKKEQPEIYHQYINSTSTRVLRVKEFK